MAIMFLFNLNLTIEQDMWWSTFSARVKGRVELIHCLEIRGVRPTTIKDLFSLAMFQ